MDNMKIWHESLIPKLCDEHLQKMWSDAHLLYYLISDPNHIDTQHFKDAFTEFKGCPLQLAWRINLVRDEMNKRLSNRGQFVIKPSIHPFDVTDEPFMQYFLEKKRYTPYYSIEQQKKFLQNRTCRIGPADVDL